jgi:hypothetical protein
MDGPVKNDNDLLNLQEVEHQNKEKQLDLKAPKLNQEWAEFKSELTEKPSSLTAEVYDQYTRFKAGNFSVPTATFTGAEARKRANEYNKQAKEIYDKAAREFLNRSISIKPPTKNQQKLQVPDNLLAVPPPIPKAIKGKVKQYKNFIFKRIPFNLNVEIGQIFDINKECLK